MRILFFSPRPFWPLDTGAKLRDYHLARQLALRADVTYLSFAEPGGAEPPQDGTASVFERVVTVPRDKGYTPAKLVRGLVGDVPVTVLNYTTPAMKAMLAGLLDSVAFDAVQMESVHLAEYTPIIRRNRRNQPRLISDWHNLESEVMFRYSLQSGNVAERLYARTTAGSLEVVERRLLAAADGVCVCSERERRVVERWNGDRPVEVVENGVDTAYYSDEEMEQACGAAPAERNTLVYVGSMDYHANIDAVVWFTAEVWPKLAAAHPELVFKIVGRNPAQAVKELASRERVVVTGSVDDVRPYYREALASVVPLRVGGGTRLKILEAMAAGTPVISTSLGAEGLKVTAARDLLIAESPEDFELAVATLKASPEYARELGEHGREAARARYDWSAIGTVLYDWHLRAQEAEALVGVRG